MHLDHLPNQTKDEHLVSFLRSHWIIPLKIWLFCFALFLVPLVIAIPFLDDIPVILSHEWLGPLVVILISLYLLALNLFTFQQFITYYLDTWIVTTERIISVEQESLFHRTTSETHLATIQDATAEIHGFLHTMLDYGDVFVQTAAEKERFSFHNIPHPEKVKQLVLKLIEADKSRHGGNTALAPALKQ